MPEKVSSQTILSGKITTLLKIQEHYPLGKKDYHKLSKAAHYHQNVTRNTVLLLCNSDFGIDHLPFYRLISLEGNLVLSSESYALS